MDERELTGRLPGEVVEVYRQKEHREVVEVYTRPLPSALAPRPVLTLPKKRGKKGLWIFLTCLAVVALLSAAGWAASRWFFGWQGGYPENDDFFREEISAEITIPVWPFGQGAELTVSRDHDEPLPIQEVYRRVNPAVVTVMAELDPGYSVGTGVLFTADGYILTNYHVVAGGSGCLVALESGHQYEAMYVAGDMDSDLAVLKVEAEDLPAAPFGDSDQLVVGDPVYAIGNPLGVELRGTLTDGIVSAINRDVIVDGRSMTLIQTNAALNTGNSGGPLINQYGQVVGINVIKMTNTQYSDATVEGIGFAIPTSFLKRIVNDLLTFGEVQPEPLLGISVYNTATQLDENLWGAGIESVTPGGAGDKAGIRPGDYLLASGETPLTTSDDVLKVRREYYVGDEMPMTIWRDGAIIEVILQLEQAVK